MLLLVPAVLTVFFFFTKEKANVCSFSEGISEINSSAARSQFGALVLRHQQRATVHHEGRRRVAHGRHGFPVLTRSKMQFRWFQSDENKRSFMRAERKHPGSTAHNASGWWTNQKLWVSCFRDHLKTPPAWRRRLYGDRKTLQDLWCQKSPSAKVFNPGNNYWWLDSNQRSFGLYFHIYSELLSELNYSHWLIDD